MAMLNNQMVYSTYTMWVKECHKPPICKWFVPPISGDLGDGL